MHCPETQEPLSVHLYAVYALLRLPGLQPVARPGRTEGGNFDIDTIFTEFLVSTAVAIDSGGVGPDGAPSAMDTGAATDEAGPRSCRCMFCGKVEAVVFPYPVPTTPATVISAVSASPATLICWHTTDVAELHDDVLHGADPSAAVAV